MGSTFVTVKVEKSEKEAIIVLACAGVRYGPLPCNSEIKTSSLAIKVKLETRETREPDKTLFPIPYLLFSVTTTYNLETGADASDFKCYGTIPDIKEHQCGDTPGTYILLDQNNISCGGGPAYVGLFGPLLTSGLYLKVGDITDLNTFDFLSVGIPNQETSTKSFNRFFNNNIDNLMLNIYVQTDRLGLNLGEMIAIVTSDVEYPNGYPKKLIGNCKDLDITFSKENIETFYSKRPNIKKVLICCGDSLLEQTNKINSIYHKRKANCEFFGEILIYCAIRYMLGGLINGSIFSCKWLYANNYKKFIYDLENSEFSEFVTLFTQPQPEYGVDFRDFNKYFKSCPCKK